jgi:hypothetical protein
MEGVWRYVAWCTERNISGIYLKLVRNSKEKRTSVGIFLFEPEKPKSLKYEEVNRTHIHTRTHTDCDHDRSGVLCSSFCKQRNVY